MNLNQKAKVNQDMKLSLDSTYSRLKQAHDNSVLQLQSELDIELKNNASLNEEIKECRCSNEQKLKLLSMEIHSINSQLEEEGIIAENAKLLNYELSQK